MEHDNTQSPPTYSDLRHRKNDSSFNADWRGHLGFGWYALLFYLVLGATLEMFHGFKVDFYLNVANETRRLLWTLAHAHGTLLALINIAFALTIRVVPDFRESTRRFASRCLIAATLLLPCGFFFGGWFVAAGDPGLPVVLVPVGAILLFIGVLIAARMAKASSDAERQESKPRRKQLTRA